MENDVKEIKQIIDILLIETASNTAHLKTITNAFFEVSAHLLDKDELANLKSHYYHTLFERTSRLLNQTDLYNPEKAFSALADLKVFVDEHLKT